MELDIIQMEHASHESSKDSTKGKQYSTPAGNVLLTRGVFKLRISEPKKYYHLHFLIYVFLFAVHFHVC